MRKKKIDWTNTLFVTSAHALGLAGLLYPILVHFSWWTLGLALVWMASCGLAITGGYHRLFSHPTYKAHPALRALYLLFGAGGVQNSALKWSADHRRHHTRVDREEDPYNIRRGFWWAHIGWVFFEDSQKTLTGVKDLEADPMVRLQHRYYLPLAILMGGLMPMALAALWGDALGGLLVAGFLRLVIQWHATFSVNSFAHMLGSRPYCTEYSARDSFITALLTLGEGYHNFHHRFQSDYRNGVRWFHFDPTKWFVWTMSKVGVCRDLRRVPATAIARARSRVRGDLGRMG